MRKIIFTLFIAALIAIGYFTNVGYAIAAFFALIIIWVVIELINLAMDFFKTK